MNYSNIWKTHYARTENKKDNSPRINKPELEISEFFKVICTCSCKRSLEIRNHGGTSVPILLAPLTR